MTSLLRRLTVADVPEALQLSAAAGWNQTAADWLTLMQVAPETCFAIECDGTLVATTTLVCYGEQLAWVGMVLTNTRFQRRGFASRLVDHALECADARGIASVKLDATEQGLPVYERLGFRAEQEIQRWAATPAVVAGPSPPSSDSASTPTCSLELKLDRAASGVDRYALLQMLNRRIPPRCNHEGFLLSRPGARASYIGPFVARNRDAADRLVRSCFNTGDTTWFWDILSSNHDAVSLASEFGFTPRRTLMRMVRGADLRGNDNLTYGIAGFELG